jgi:hypothetical protein
MSESREIKIVFTGPMGAGKTTAIGAISDVATVSTEVGNNDRIAFDKEATTVALDYGQVSLPDGTAVRLYGTPGQERFGFMRKILGQGALGVILLLDGSRPDVVADLDTYVTDFLSLSPRPEIVVGIGRCESGDSLAMARCTSHLGRAGVVVPAFSVDVRQRRDVLLLVETLLCLIEAANKEYVREH